MLNIEQNHILSFAASNPIVNVKNISLRYKEKTFLFFINIFVYLFILSGPLNYFYGINNRALTAIAYFLLISFLLFFYVSPLLEKLNVYVIYFIFYILIRFFIEVFLMDSNWFQPFVSVLKFGCFSIIVWIFTSLKFSKLFIKKIQFSIFIFFIVTVMISALQSFKLPFYDIFSFYGGNIISGTILGNVRVNGGISGTAIDYACLIIILNSLLFIIWDTINRKQKIFFMLIILYAAFMNFSRVVFISLPLLFFSFLISRRYNIKVSLSNFLIISIIILISILVFFTFKNSLLPQASYIFSYDVYRQASDQIRLNMWEDSLKSLNTPGKVLIGNSLGLSTGLPPVGKTKLSADGHWAAAISDFGILGFFLYILIYINVALKLLKCSFGKKNRTMIIGLLITIMFFNLVNSGFEHSLNMLILPIVFGIIINQKR